MDIVCCMAMVFLALKVYLIAISRILSLFSRIFMKDMCEVALIRVVMTMRESTFQPFVIEISNSHSYFSILIVIVLGENLSLQYVNSIIWTIKLLIGLDRRLDWYSKPLMHRIFGLSLALQ